MNYKNYQGIYLKSDENVVHEARFSTASLIITWLAIPGVLFIFFMITYVPYLIRSRILRAFKDAAMEEMGVTAGESEGLFDLIGGMFGAIPSFLLVLLCIPILLLVLAWLGWCLVMTGRHAHSSLAITDFRVIGRSKGEEMDSPLSKIVNVFLEQSLWGKLFNYGNLTVHTQKLSVTFYHVDDPQAVRYLLMKDIENP